MGDIRRQTAVKASKGQPVRLKGSGSAAGSPRTLLGGKKLSLKDAAFLDAGSQRTKESARSAGRKAAKLALERIQLNNDETKLPFAQAAQQLLKVMVIHNFKASLKKPISYYRSPQI